MSGHACLNSTVCHCVDELSDERIICCDAVWTCTLAAVRADCQVNSGSPDKRNVELAQLPLVLVVFRCVYLNTVTG
jgi:hypothetical protein